MKTTGRYALSICLFTASLLVHSSAAQSVLLSPHSSPGPLMPQGCREPLAEQYIELLKQKKWDSDSIPAQAHVQDARWITWDKDQNLIPCPKGGVAKSPVKFCWRALSDAPHVMGIVRLAKVNAKPHFHSQEECFYTVSGKGETWAQKRMAPLKKGHYLHISPSTIHYTKNLQKTELVLLYWFPKDARFETFKYFFRDNVDATKKKVFDQVPYYR